MTESESRRLQMARIELQQAHAAYEAKLAVFSRATAGHGALEAQLAAARRTARVTPQTQSFAASLEAAWQASREKTRLAQTEAEEAQTEALRAIRSAGRLVQTAGAPLLQQFRRGMAKALRAFCVDPTATAEIIPEHTTEFPSLVGFLQRGQHVSRHAGPEEIEALTADLGETLRRLIEGEHVWLLRDERSRDPSTPSLSAIRRFDFDA